MADERGLYHKYQVYKHGDPIGGWCFVIEEDDPCAIPALAAYAKAVRKHGNERLADDLLVKCDEIRSATESGRAADTGGRE